jgi:dTDP-glucose 4,6-dehydratase
MKILITGGAGFIGHHLVEHLLKNTDWDIVILDRLNYAANGLNRLRDIECFEAHRARVKVLTADFTKPIVDGIADEIGNVDYIAHLGAETHVDNSISNAEPFVMSNVLGTMQLLEFARTQRDLRAFIYFSTDEVFGPAPEGVFYKEWDRYNSGNPYSAAKAGGEELCLAYSNTYRIPMIITHCMNVFGERQHKEKFIPKVVKAVLEGETVYIHSNKDKTEAGTRFYIHARNVAAALLFILGKWPQFNIPDNIKEEGYFGPHIFNPGFAPVDKFNIVGEREVSNLEMAQFIAGVVGKPLKYELVDFHSSRPGHDLRYALDGEKLKAMGWSLPLNFEESLRNTVLWTLQNKDKWLN